MNEPLTLVSEETANELLLAFQRVQEESGNMFAEWEQAINDTWKSELQRFELLAGLCSLRQNVYRYKLNKASFITHWYWKRKLYKALIALRKYNHGINYIKSIIV